MMYTNGMIRILTHTLLFSCTILFVLTTPLLAKGVKKMIPKTEIATFAGGCFWCMQPAFDATPGVIKSTVGYTGGTLKNPTYQDICTGTTGHFEAIQVIYDPSKVSYPKLIDVFWHQIDPTDTDGQFADTGSQYKTAIFYHSPLQKSEAEKAKLALEKSGQFHKPIATALLPGTVFYAAEEEHQKYYQKRTLHYQLYKKGSGRANYIEKTWGTH